LEDSIPILFRLQESFLNTFLDKNKKKPNNKLSESIIKKDSDIANFNLIKLKKNILSLGYHSIKKIKNLKFYIFK